MSGIRQIFGKEMARIFRDKKMMFSVFLLPVVIMVVILAVINTLVSNMQEDIRSHVAEVYMVREPESFAGLLEASGDSFHVVSLDTEGEMEEAREAVLAGEADLIVEFPEGFEESVGSYEAGSQIPQIKTYYNPSENYSAAAFDSMNQLLEGYRQTLLSQRVADLSELTVFQVNTDNPEMVIQDEAKASNKAIGMLLPYFITILLFAGAMGIGTDMIAGEKERGTMASLLVAPVKRSSIALGKVFALMLVSGVSSLIYVAAMVICAPIMKNSMAMGSLEELNISLSPAQVLMLGAMMVAIAFLYASIIALISVFAKSVKEANTYVMPIYMLILIVGLLTMFTSGSPGMQDYMIPFYNNALALQAVLSQEVSALQYGIALLETFVLGGLLLAVIVKAFESEKIMSA